MNDTTPRTAAGKGLWHFSMPLDMAVTTGARPYGDDWGRSDLRAHPPPEDAISAEGVTFLDCDPAEAVRIALGAADGRNLKVLSPTIGRQLLERGLIDEIDLQIAPVLPGGGSGSLGEPGRRADPAQPGRRRPQLGGQRPIPTHLEDVIRTHPRKESPC